MPNAHVHHPCGAGLPIHVDKFAGVGSRSSALTVVCSNQGSKQDVEALIDYIYATLGMDLNYILPVTTIPENGREIDSLDDMPELAHQIALVTNLNPWCCQGQ
jgi:fatty acid synthase subunit alpha